MSSRQDVLNNNTNSFPNNNSGQITPAVLRDFNADFINSVVFIGDTVGNATNAATASHTPNAIVTASAVDSTITFTKGNGSTFNVTVAQSGSLS